MQATHTTPAYRTCQGCSTCTRAANIMIKWASAAQKVSKSPPTLFKVGLSPYLWVWAHLAWQAAHHWGTIVSDIVLLGVHWLRLVSRSSYFVPFQTKSWFQFDWNCFALSTTCKSLSRPSSCWSILLFLIAMLLTRYSKPKRRLHLVFAGVEKIFGWLYHLSL